MHLDLETTRHAVKARAREVALRPRRPIFNLKRDFSQAVERRRDCSARPREATTNVTPTATCDAGQHRLPIRE